MGTLQDALRQAGVADERQFREAEAQKFLDAEIAAGRLAKAASDKEKRIANLKNETSPDTFRREARRLLLQYPSSGLVQEVLEILRCRGLVSKKGGARINAQLIGLREELKKPGMSDEARGTLVDKLFPKK